LARIGRAATTGKAIEISTGATSNDKDRIQTRRVIGGTLGLMVLIVVLNFYPERIGFLRTITEPSSFVPLLAPDFRAHLPWLNLWCGLTLALCLVMLYHGRWQSKTRWAAFGLSVLGIFVMGRLVVGGPIIGLDPESVEGQSLSRELLAQLKRDVDLLGVVVKVLLGVTVVVLEISIVNKVLRVLGNRPVDVRMQYVQVKEGHLPGGGD
jgi:hypothetical protein